MKIIGVHDTNENDLSMIIMFKKMQGFNDELEKTILIEAHILEVMLLYFFLINISCYEV